MEDILSSIKRIIAEEGEEAAQAVSRRGKSDASSKQAGEAAAPVVDEVLEFLNLGDRAGDPVHGFSGGMKQRVSLACALVHQPRLLLLDEPSTGVDPKLRESLWSHFHDLTKQGGDDCCQHPSDG